MQLIAEDYGYDCKLHGQGTFVHVKGHALVCSCKHECPWQSL